MTFPQIPVGCALDAEAKRLVVSKVGRIKVELHRSLEGMPKTATIRHTATGKWFVTFICAWEPTPQPPTGQEVGLDVGLKVFAMPSQGREIENPRFFCKEERALAKVQRQHQAALDAHKAVRAALTTQIQAQQPGMDAQTIWQVVSQDAGEHDTWRERQHRRWVVARTQERIRWRRGNFAHQESRRLTDTYDVLTLPPAEAGGFSVLRGGLRHASPKALPKPLSILGGVVVAMQAGSAVRATCQRTESPSVTTTPQPEQVWLV